MLFQKNQKTDVRTENHMTFEYSKIDRTIETSGREVS